MEIRELDAGHLGDALDVRTRAFGYLDQDGRTGWHRTMVDAVREHRALAAYDGDRLAAVARITGFVQFWQGRGVPMAGVGGVVVAPEDRGRGVGRLLMTALLERCAQAGYPLSVLYPATTPLYRGLGWEHAGAQHRITVPAAELRTVRAPGSGGAVKLRRVGADDAAEVLATLRAAYQANRDCGPVTWTEEAYRRWLADERLFCYLAEDGFLGYAWAGGDTLRVELAVAASEATTRTLWAMVGSGSSVARTVHACVPPHDPVRWLTREAAVTPDEERGWMLRLVDASAAVAGRGFPPGVEAQALLAVTDAQLPANTGLWGLTVAGGAGRLARLAADPGGDPAALSLGPGGLAALYAGTPVATLRRAGLARGATPATDALLDAAFAARPYLFDYF